MRDQARREVVAEQELTEQTAAEESPTRERYGAGRIPPVEQGFGEQPGTAQLAFEEDENERELKTKVAALVANKFGGDYNKAFAHYDSDGDGGIGKRELVDLLADAKVGNGLTRGIWAGKIIDKLDTGGDRKIQWPEFESVFTAHA
jgi:hypothetical protein